MTASELRAIRARLGLTQRQLAAAIEYRDSMSVSRWERGIKAIPPRAALAIEHLECHGKSRLPGSVE